MDLDCKPVNPVLGISGCKPILPVLMRGKTTKRLCFPATCFKAYWTGYSSNVVDLPVLSAGLEQFSLENMQKYKQQNFLLAVRDGLNHWKLWKDVRENLNLPLYGGQLLSKNAVFEIWTVQGSPATVSTPNFCVNLVSYSCCDTVNISGALLATLKQKFLGVCGHVTSSATASNGPFLFALTNPC